MAWHEGQPAYRSSPVSRYVRENLAYLKDIADLLTNAGITEDDLSKLHAITKSASEINADKMLRRGSYISMTVGSGGSYSTINAALAALSTYYPIYVSGGFTARVRLLSGFVMSEQVLVSGLDLSWVSITSVDAEVVVARSALTTEFEGRYPAFGVRRGKLPVIGALFSMDTSGAGTSRDGIMAVSNSDVAVSASCGVKNAGGSGINCFTLSRVLADETDFSGADTCVAVSRGGQTTVRSATLTGATTRGVYAYDGGFINAGSSNCQKGGSPAATDIVVGNGGVVVAKSATGGLSQTANTVAAAGIIYQ